MRIFFFVLLLLAISPVIGVSYADDISSCLKACSYDRHTNDLNCPSGESSTEEQNQCLAQSDATYNDCVKRCTPSSDRTNDSATRDQQGR